MKLKFDFSFSKQERKIKLRFWKWVIWSFDLKDEK